MKKHNVYFSLVHDKKLSNLPKIALNLFKTLLEKEKINLENEIPIKVHVGEPGNISYIKPDNYQLIMEFLKEKKIKTYFVETTPVTGQRNTAEKHCKVAQDHGFNQIPFVIADGELGNDEIEVNLPIKTKHFQKAKIAAGLADRKQVLVISHFKGHIATGFGGAIKNLGIGFASRNGKMHQHLKNYYLGQKTIDWSKSDQLYHLVPFEERVAEYALAASYGKKHLYLNFAINIVENCDCDGMPMKPIYPDLGIFASTDPVAIDKACFDLLRVKIGKKPFEGEEIFFYGEKIGLGFNDYKLIEIK